MVVVKIFPQQLGIGAFPHSWGTEEEEEFLFAGGEIVENSAGDLKHVCLW